MLLCLHDGVSKLRTYRSYRMMEVSWRQSLGMPAAPSRTMRFACLCSWLALPRPPLLRRLNCFPGENVLSNGLLAKTFPFTLPVCIHAAFPRAASSHLCILIRCSMHPLNGGIRAQHLCLQPNLQFGLLFITKVIGRNLRSSYL